MRKKDGALDQLRTLQGSSVGYLLIRAGQLFNEEAIGRVNAEAGALVLREAHTRLLPYLMVEDGVRITALAKQVGITKQAVQQLVADLADLGVVALAADPDDARARRVVLTELGLQALAHGTGVLLAIEDELAARLSRTSRRALRSGLAALLAVLEERRAAREA